MSQTTLTFFIQYQLTLSWFWMIKQNYIWSNFFSYSFYPFQIMRTYLLIFSFLILTWQAIVITNTLATRLEQRTQQVHQLLKDI